MNAAIAHRVAGGGGGGSIIIIIRNFIRSTTAALPPPHYCFASAGVRRMSTEEGPPEPKNHKSLATPTLEPKRWVNHDSRDFWHFPALQVLSVQITEVNIPMIDEDQIGIYGSISATDWSHLWEKLYLKGRSSFEYVKLKEDMKLSSPRRRIHCSNGSYIHFEIHFVGKELAEDKTLVEGEIEVYPIIGRAFQTQTVRGKYGAMEITYAFMWHALEATVEIHSRSNSRGSLAKLAARVCDFMDEYVQNNKLVLFDRTKSANQEIISLPDGTFQLWRSVLTVPAYGGLMLEVHIDPLDGDDCGSMQFFSAAELNVEDKNVALNSEMVLKVAWSSSWHTVLTTPTD